MSKFKVSDKIKYAGDIFRIVDIESDEPAYLVESSTDGSSYWVFSSDIEPSEEEKKYTIEEIFQAIDEYGDKYAPWHKLEIIKYALEKPNDPEYREYLRLKAKFE